MRLAHLSDSHILPDGAPVHGIDTMGRLALAVEALNGFGSDLDAVVLTGDLTESPSPAAYETLKNVLEPLTAPYFLIPGNHDDRDMLRAAFVGTPAAPYSEGFAHYVIDDFPVRLIGLDSTLKGSDLPEFCPIRAEWLDDTLTARPETPTLLCIHHPPIAVGLSMVDDVVSNGWAVSLSEIVERHRQVGLIACGHAHTMLNSQMHGARVCMAPSTAFQFRHRLGADEAPVRVDRPGEIVMHYWNGESFITVPFDARLEAEHSSIEALSGRSWTELKKAMGRRPS